MGCSDSKESTVKIIKPEDAEKKRLASAQSIVSSTPISPKKMGVGASTDKTTKSRNTSKLFKTNIGHTRKPIEPITNGNLVEYDLEQEYVKNSSTEMYVDLPRENNDSLNVHKTILDSIPNSDLGESLDARKATSLWRRNKSDISPPVHRPFPEYPSTASASSSTKSFESSDSGVYVLDDIITENSPQELVDKIEKEFTPVENIDLTITGKACPRLLSGSQKVRQQEQDIMDNLRAEGFISTTKQRASGGLAFEVVEDSPIVESAGGKIKPMNFLPQKHKDRLEKQIDKFHMRDLSSADVERRQFLAEERRKLGIDAKLEKLSTLTNKSNLQEKTEEFKRKKEKKENAALEKRESHLRELRDKIKAQNQKAKQIKLKKLINGPPVPVPYVAAHAGIKEDDDFF